MHTCIHSYIHTFTQYIHTYIFIIFAFIPFACGTRLLCFVCCPLVGNASNPYLQIYTLDLPPVSGLQSPVSGLRPPASCFTIAMLVQTPLSACKSLRPLLPSFPSARTVPRARPTFVARPFLSSPFLSPDCALHHPPLTQCHWPPIDPPIGPPIRSRISCLLKSPLLPSPSPATTSYKLPPISHFGTSMYPCMYVYVVWCHAVAIPCASCSWRT